MAVQPIENLEGFFVDRQLDRCVHITFEDESTFVVDLWDSTRAAQLATGKCLASVRIDLISGLMEIVWP